MSIENFSTKGQVYLKDERQQSEVKKNRTSVPTKRRVHHELTSAFIRRHILSTEWLRIRTIILRMTAPSRCRR